MVKARPSLSEIERRVLDIASEQLGIRRIDLHPGLRVIDDLHVDSLDTIELLMGIEDEFRVSLPENSSEPSYDQVFTRRHFTLGDLAELVYLRLDQPHIIERKSFRARFTGGATTASSSVHPFTQLSGRYTAHQGPLYESLGYRRYRRRTDGMIAIHIPGGVATLGSDTGEHDQHPAHRAHLSDFLLDRETVSTTAYARFLNSIEGDTYEHHQQWFLLDGTDHRRAFELLQLVQGEWHPVPGTERWPMVLVSWYGAAAYSLWANGFDWRGYCDTAFLPTEAQWEYAARGPNAFDFPWGNTPPNDTTIAPYGRSFRDLPKSLRDLPVAEVHQPLSVSPFGVYQMAGNVWQWCNDHYDPTFYQQPAATAFDPLNPTNTGIRSERGGSWVGSLALCRSSYRRGRVPHAKGRCLGFRCIGHL